MATPPRWAHHTEGHAPVHVWPLDDLIDHDTEDDEGNCVCVPTVEAVTTDTGSTNWLYTHHSLDGREHHEQ